MLAVRVHEAHLGLHQGSEAAGTVFWVLLKDFMATDSHAFVATCIQPYWLLCPCVVSLIFVAAMVLFLGMIDTFLLFVV